MKYKLLLFIILLTFLGTLAHSQSPVHKSVSKSLIGCEGAEIREKGEGAQALFPEVRHYNGYIDIGTGKDGVQFPLQEGDIVCIDYTSTVGLNGVMSVAAYGGAPLVPLSANPFMGSGKQEKFIFYVPTNCGGKPLTALYLTFYNNTPGGVFEFRGASVSRFQKKPMPLGYSLKEIIPAMSIPPSFALAKGDIIFPIDGGKVKIGGKSYDVFKADRDIVIEDMIIEGRNAMFLCVYTPPVSTRLDAEKILKETEPYHNTKVENIMGDFAITLDGKPISPMGWSAIIPSNQPDDYIKDMVYNTSFKLARCMVFLGDTYLKYAPNTQSAPDTFNYDYIDRELDRILNANPETKIILQVDIDGLDWFLKEHPEVVGDNPNMPDFLHPLWLLQEKDMIDQFVAHIQSNERYNRAVVGYQIMNGYTLDCSFDITVKTPEAKKRFRQFLKDKYKTEKALQEAWGNRKVTFDNAEYKEMSKESEGLLLLSPKDRQAEDSLRWVYKSNADSLLFFCKCIKEATHGRAITGARAGNFYVGGWVKPTLMGNGTDFQTLMESPYIDYLENWEPYPGRWTGYNGGGDPVNPVYAMAGYGKMHMLQNDVRTHTGPDRGYGACKDEEEALVKQKRVFVNSLTNGQQEYLWQMDYRFNTPLLMDFWHKAEDIYLKSFKRDRERDAELCYVLDPNYCYYLGLEEEFNEPTRGFPLGDYPRFLFGRAGVPYETIFIDQLDKYDKYKVYVFFLTFNFDKNTINKIEKEIIAKGKSAIFLWGSGFYEGMDLFEKNFGMKIDADRKEGKWSSVPTSSFAEEMNIPSDYEMGTLRFSEPNLPNVNIYSWAPMFSVDSSTATPLALYKDSGKVSVAYKKVGDSYIYYCGTAYPAPPLVRYALKNASAHIYTDTEDWLYMNNSFIGFYTTEFADKIQLNLKEPSCLYDIFNDVSYDKNTSFELKVAPRDTYLFYRGTKEDFYNIK